MSRSKKPVSSSAILIIGGLAWSVIALLYFLLFSVPLPGEELPIWYSYGTYIFELGAWLASAFLCFRNCFSPHMVSGRNVWAFLGWGMLCYFLGGLMFGVWELVFKLDPDVSPADAVYLASYLFLGLGMIFAVTSKRLMLEPKQWLIVIGVGVAGIALALLLNAPAIFGTGTKSSFFIQPSTKTIIVASASENYLTDLPINFVQGTNTPKSSPLSKPSPAKPTKEESEEEEKSDAPKLILDINEALLPYAYPVNLFYIIGDVVLLIIATALLLAFWGGRYSQSWRMIAAATFCLYIADMYSKWESNLPEPETGVYQSGSWPEVFFVFSAVLFGIGALLEHDISLSSRRGPRRRGAGGR